MVNPYPDKYLPSTQNSRWHRYWNYQNNSPKCRAYHCSVIYGTKTQKVNWGRSPTGGNQKLQMIEDVGATCIQYAKHSVIYYDVWSRGESIIYGRLIQIRIYKREMYNLWRQIAVDIICWVIVLKLTFVDVHPFTVVIRFKTKLRK